MTLEQLYNITPAEIDNLPWSEVEAICAPFLHLTRPELVEKPKPKVVVPKDREKEKKIEQAKMLAAALGIKLK